MHLEIETVTEQWDRFDTIIDVRSPGEWAVDHLPGAINVPVLSDMERDDIGRRYAASAFEAKKKGAALVARNIANALETQFDAMPREWRPLIYCWRGGNRSQAMATVMERIGWRPTLLSGGYVAFRRHVVSALERLASSFQFTVICGVTGAGKSLFLRTLGQQGHQILDLEALANHRGSLLGSEPTGGQPSQKAFDTAVWNILRRLDPARQVFVESESKKIGALQVPSSLIMRMRASPCIELNPSLEERVRYLLQDYSHFFNNPDTLISQLERLRPLVGGDRINEWRGYIERYDWSSLVTSLLIHHYDPTYRRSMRNNFSRYDSAQVVSGHPMDRSVDLAAV
jgi:tRNA 2-selenouridine synthase